MRTKTVQTFVFGIIIVVCIDRGIIIIVKICIKGIDFRSTAVYHVQHGNLYVFFYIDVLMRLGF